MLHAVVMAGGSGTRFWPLSRVSKPKQFLPLTGGEPLIVETAHRMKGLPLWVVCGETHAKVVRRVLKKAKTVVEPQARNTAPAIALATLHVAHLDPKAILAVIPSDQHVADVKAFRATLEVAAQAAAQDYIVTLGITPTRPDTGYGYIEVGESLGAALRVQKFVEKPDRATAEKYLAAQTYVWNAGMFVFKAETMFRAFERYMPDLYQALMALKPTVGTKRYAKALKKYFSQMPATSIDYGIAERADNMAVVPGNFGWSDVGSFDALPEVRRLDEDGNVVEGSAVVVDSKGCVVLGGKRLLAVVGMQDAVVVDSDDAVLVLPKSSSQNVRKVVERLKANSKLKRYL